MTDCFRIQLVNIGHYHETKGTVLE